MAATSVNTVLHRLRKSILIQNTAELTDGQLLEAFIAAKDEDAFEMLLRRHGPMVLGVCCRVLSVGYRRVSFLFGDEEISREGMMRRRSLMLSAAGNVMFRVGTSGAGRPCGSVGAGIGAAGVGTASVRVGGLG